MSISLQQNTLKYHDTKIIANTPKIWQCHHEGGSNKSKLR
jgi:hypothetical protein